MEILQQNKLLANHLGQFVSDHKKEFIERVLDQRTRYVALALEDIYQSQNASAVMRTCECLGIQDIHVIETNSQWTTNKLVLKGADKWLNIKRYRRKSSNNTADCIHYLRDQGYRIAVADPAPDGVPVEEMPIDEPVAIVMGNEKHGASRYALDHADLKVHIPMVGFTESLNISVSAAIILNLVLSRLRQSSMNWQLKEDEKVLLRLTWFKGIVRRPELIEREFLRTIG